MSYAFEIREPVETALRRLVHEQIDKALAAIDEEDRHEAIHEARKRCKKVRAAARIVRPAFDDYREANVFFRDTARLISDLRDATAHVETLDAIASRRGEALDVDAIGALRQALMIERDRLSREQNIDDRLETVRTRLTEGKRHAADWSLDGEGFEAMAAGLAKTHRRARKRAKEAQRGDETELFHEWRKRVKYHRYQVKMLRRCFPTLLEAREEASHDLTDHLGDAHDLAVLQSHLTSSGLDEDHRSMAIVIDDLASSERARLRARSRQLGRKLFLAQETGAFVARVGAWWEVAHEAEASSQSSSA